MSFITLLEHISIDILFLPTIIIVLAGILITFKTRFIQLRAVPTMLKTLFRSLTTKKQIKNKETIKASRALFTAMSTTIGTSSIVSPAIAIKLGGPGALVGFMISSLLGGALIYTEVTLALKYRKKMPDGSIMGGPMQYLQTITPSLGKIYAIGGVAMLVIWSSLQANTLSDLLVPYHIPGYVTGLILAALVLAALTGGIKRIGAISEKLVPFMFFLYTGAALWVILMNISRLSETFDMIFRSAFSARALFGGAAGGGLFHALRWGLLRGVQANEAGVGTSSIPHSMADVSDPEQQGILSMVAIYSQAFICILSGLMILLTGTWQDPNISFGINMITQAFAMHFSAAGPLILTISAILFAYGTILGNSYNGSQCFNYFTRNKNLKAYYFIIAALIFIGAIADVKSLWIISDFFLIPVAISNVIGIVYLSFKSKSPLHDAKG